MTTKPIIFSGPMVRALLDGTKTQTRRLFWTRKDLPEPHTIDDDPFFFDQLILRWHSGMRHDYVHPVAVGDLLWVRENWSGMSKFENIKPSQRESFSWEGVIFDKHDIHYWADGHLQFGDWEKTRPSIHMPRWASRLTLKVTGVRVERLQDISREDCVAEGCSGWVSHDQQDGQLPEDQFRDLWDSLNAKRAPWVSNPWVVAYTFEVARQNVDQVAA